MGGGAMLPPHLNLQTPPDGDEVYAVADTADSEDE